MCGGGRGSSTESEVHVVGWTGALDDKRKRAKMYRWLYDMKTRMPEPSHQLSFLDQYVLIPPVKAEVDPKTKRVVYWRFNCASFVAKCYEKGGNIKLVDCESDKFPDVDRHLLNQIYGSLSKLLDRYGDQLGLTTNKSSWPLLLPGYIFHALARNETEILATHHHPASTKEARFP